MNPGAPRQRPMAFPGLIGGIFCKTQETNPYGLRFLSQVLYPPEVINVVGFLAQEYWEGGGLRGLGFCAGARSRIWGLWCWGPDPHQLGPLGPLCESGRRTPSPTHARHPFSPRPFLVPKPHPPTRPFFPVLPVHHVAFSLPACKSHVPMPTSLSLCRPPCVTCFHHLTGR